MSGDVGVSTLDDGGPILEADLHPPAVSLVVQEYLIHTHTSLPPSLLYHEEIVSRRERREEERRGGGVRRGGKKRRMPTVMTNV